MRPNDRARDRLPAGYLSVRAGEGNVRRSLLIAGGGAGEQTFVVVDAVDGGAVDLAELGFDATASIIY